MKNFTLIVFAMFISLGLSAQVDLQLDMIASPAQDDTLEMGTTVSVSFQVTNNGPGNLNMGDTIVATVIFDSDPSTLVTGATLLSTTFASGSTLTFTFVDPVDLPNTPGAHEICMNVLTSGDTDPSNNTRCNDIALYDAVTVAELTKGVDRVFYGNQELVMSFANINSGTASVNVIDITGRVVKSEVLNRGSGSTVERMGLGELPQGIYFSTVQVNGADAVTTKFMVH